MIVELNVPWQPEGNLGQEAALAQRKAIDAAQKKLLTELAGTGHRVVWLYEGIPGIALEVGPDALSALERSAQVVKITEDVILRHGLEHRVPQRTNNERT